MVRRKGNSFGLPDEVLDRTGGLISWYQESNWSSCISRASVSSWWKCDSLLYLVLYQTLGLSFNAVAFFHARFLKKEKKESTTFSILELREHNFPDDSCWIFLFTNQRCDVSHVSLIQLETFICTCQTKKIESVTPAKPPLYSFVPTVSSTVHGNKSHPVEAGVSNSVRIVNGGLKHPLALPFVPAVGQADPVRRRVRVFVFAWLLVQDLPPAACVLHSDPLGGSFDPYLLCPRSWTACRSLTGGSRIRTRVPLPDQADLSYRIWASAL